MIRFIVPPRGVHNILLIAPTRFNLIFDWCHSIIIDIKMYLLFIGELFQK